MFNRSKYSIIIFLLIIAVYRFYGLYGVYVFLLFLGLNMYLINRNRIKSRIYKNTEREEITEKLLNQSAGNFYLAVDPDNPDRINRGQNEQVIPKPCPNCQADLILGLNYCEECGFKLA